MTIEQRNEVRHYLLTKKIPLDIFIEIEDHIINQVEEFLLKDNMTFAEAFNQAKSSWRKDLATEQYYNGNEIASFAKKIKDRETSKVSRNALLSLALYFVLLFCTSKMLSKEVFVEFFIYHLYIFGAFPGTLYLFNIKIFNYIQRYPKVKFSIYQTSNFLVFFIGLLIFTVGSKAGFYAENIYRFFNTFHDGFSSFLVCTVFSMFYFCGFYMQLSFINSFKKNKNFFTDVMAEN